MRSRRGATILAAATVLQLSGCGGAPPALHVGALFPLSGPISSLAQEEFRGVDIARRLVNADGGVGGRQVVLDNQELDIPSQARAAVGALRDAGDAVIVGTYSSDLSLPASAAAAQAGLTYWEAGAVADRVTGRGLPAVFRVGATGLNLGENSGRFAVEQVAPRLNRRPQDLRVAVVDETDEYGTSVASAAAAATRARGAVLTGVTGYDPLAPDWPRVLGEVAAERPDVLILASHIPDGVAFRRAMLRAGLRVGALIGSTMAECGPEFGAALGPDAVGVFASDRPTSAFNPSVLGAAGRDAHDRFAAAWRQETGTEPTEEALAGFTAGWALFHDVLPRARTLDAPGIAAAARATRLAPGSLPNGAGLEFAGRGDRLGQNRDAAAVIWQWQGVRRSVTVWPPAYATGSVQMVPLPR